MSARKEEKRASLIAGVIMVLIVLLIFVGSAFIRLQLAGGEWSCALSPDPGTCAAVKGLSR